jgi:hypothetical protein
MKMTRVFCNEERSSGNLQDSSAESFMSDMVFAMTLSYLWFTSRATLSQETVP